MAFTVGEIHEGELVVLRRFRTDDAPALKESMEASHTELHRWMPWAEHPPTDESAREFVERSVQHFGGDEPANFAIVFEERIVGCCGLRPQPDPDLLEIGYWVDTRYTGRGIATEAARLLTDAALEIASVVKISCDEANTRSAAIPRRIGYVLDRVEDSTQVWLKSRAT
jgi:RimJ/RimL family protein N-acetyltransferase